MGEIGSRGNVSAKGAAPTRECTLLLYDLCVSALDTLPVGDAIEWFAKPDLKNRLVVRTMDMMDGNCTRLR